MRGGGGARCYREPLLTVFPAGLSVKKTSPNLLPQTVRTPLLVSGAIYVVFAGNPKWVVNLLSSYGAKICFKI